MAIHASSKATQGMNTSESCAFFNMLAKANLNVTKSESCATVEYLGLKVSQIYVPPMMAN